MGVPAHDARDFDFAKTFHLPIKQVIAPENSKTPLKLPYTQTGILIHSGEFSGKISPQASKAIFKALSLNKKIQKTTHYKLRDWIFSRQRYWGEPFPILWISKEDYKVLIQNENSPFLQNAPNHPIKTEIEGVLHFAIPLPEKSLPLKLPEMKNFDPPETLGQVSALDKAIEWKFVKINIHSGEVGSSNTAPEGKGWISAIRETEYYATMGRFLLVLLAVYVPS